jgi:hypothetical protein
MPIALTLLVRTWAALDAALTFFRMAPPEVESSQRFARACTKLHRLIRRAGIRWRYANVSISASGKSMLRLDIRTRDLKDESVTLMMQPSVARCLGGACLTVLEVHGQEDANSFLEYEVEELQAARAFLSELCRQTDGELPILRTRGGASPLTWDAQRQEFIFSEWVAYRVLQLYRRVGASIN